MTRPHQVTDKQLAANRRNAQHSTGPLTAEGKGASRWNALKHGVLARALIPPGLASLEPPAEFRRLFTALWQQLAPATTLEEILVERIAISYWRLGRLLGAEAGAIISRQDSAESATAEHAKARRRRAEPTLLTALTAAGDDVEHLRDLAEQ